MSLRTPDGSLIEMIYRPLSGETALLVQRDSMCTEHTSIVADGREYAPYSAENNLLTHRVVVLPSAVGEYESDESLLNDVQAFVHRYVDVSPAFEEIAAHYVLLTWGYDTFNEVPYLRVRGQYGSGKSRFLLTIGSLCMKPIFASGASTVSPLFRLIDQIGGTLIVDEADFWASDERAEITKILNNGNARGFPVLRSEVTPQKEFNPRAFNIFGPKIVATRHPFEDPALESRCLTGVLGGRPVRRDIPISLPRSFDREAEELRNKLLSYRFRRFALPREERNEVESGVGPRQAQIIAPLLSIATTDQARRRIQAFASSQTQTGQNTFMNAEREVLSSAQLLMRDPTVPLTLAALAQQFDRDWGTRYGIDVTHRWIGSIVRRLMIRPVKSHGNYTIPPTEYPHLRDLFREYGLSDAAREGAEHIDGPLDGLTAGRQLSDEGLASRPHGPQSPAARSVLNSRFDTPDNGTAADAPPR